MFFGNAAPQEGDACESECSSEVVPQNVRRQFLFQRSLQEYCSRLEGFGRERPPPVTAHTVEDDQGNIVATFEVKPRLRFLQQLLDRRSYACRKNFLNYILIQELRPLLRDPSVFEEVRGYAVIMKDNFMIQKLDRKLEGMRAARNFLREMLFEARWSEQLLEMMAYKKDNGLAAKICSVLREHFGWTEGTGEEKKSNRLLVDDVLAEVRTRLRRGQIERNDPWWPKRY